MRVLVAAWLLKETYDLKQWTDVVRVLQARQDLVDLLGEVPSLVGLLSL